MHLLRHLNMEKNVDNVSVVVNMAKNAADAAHSFQSFEKIVLQFLEVTLNFAGWLPQSQVISNSIVARKPFVINKKTI